MPKLCFRYDEQSLAEKEIKTPDDLDPAYVLEFKPESCEGIQIKGIADAIRSQLSNLALDKLATFRDVYQNTCVAQEGLQETFTVAYDLGYHHYTLYYYDRAGHLIRTVPPGGVVLAGSRSDITQHRLVTTYTYNSLGQLVRQNTPDGGTTEFFYNNKSQLRYSRNDKQGNAGGSGNEGKRWFSYTRYDQLGRVTEVGESSLTDELRSKIEDMTFPATGLRQVPQTTYTAQAPNVSYPLTNAAGVTGGQRYLQNRVSYTRIDPNPAASGDEQTTYYSYDPHGNVEWLCQQLRSVAGSEFAKFVRYEYDLISGKVLRVNYQENTDEQFYHRYGYDEDNRLTRVETSADGVIWEADAAYDYYRHGPLRRMELGQDRLQGVDYTYTIHGWLKAINAAPPAPGGGASAAIPADVFRMALTYYAGDYKRSGGGGVEAVLNPAPAPGKDLFNGNISAWSRYIAPRPGGAGGLAFDGQMTGEQFTYDELNRVKSSTFQSLTGAAAAGGAYQTSYGYDPSGNLLGLTRNDQRGRVIDNLTYRYNRDAAGGLTNNKLRGVGDVSGQALGVVNQTATDNYTYDQIGNLTADAQDGINIEWTVYGKVKTVTKTDGSQIIAYLYDASGNRTVKTVQTRNPATNAITTVSTYYVRDAQGNVLSVYDDNNTGRTLRQGEIYLYGSSRLGIYRPGNNRAVVTNGIYTRSLTRKEYELSDHLGNVRAVIGDYREADGTNPVRAALRSYANYYAFGLEMPGMSWKGNGYRYGYNGKEQDKDFANNYDYGFRIYSAGIGRFVSVDPLAKGYPGWSPYPFAQGSPIAMIDLDGLEGSFVFSNMPISTSILNTQQQHAKKYVATGDSPTKAFLKASVTAPAVHAAAVLAVPLTIYTGGRALPYLARLGLWAVENPATVKEGGKLVGGIIAGAAGYDGMDLEGPADDVGRNGTRLLLGAARSANQIRNSRGVASGLGKTVVGQWLKGSEGNAGAVPSSVADVLRGQTFNTFDDFRAAFWRAAANNADLSSQFSSSNLTLMRQGLAPFAATEQHLVGQMKYILHHIKPIQHGGNVYDMDNLMIVTPRYHKDVLPPDRHY